MKKMKAASFVVIMSLVMAATAFGDTLNINACTNMDTQNRIYNLTANISSSGTCFNVTANNVTLDCNEFTINYSQSEVGYAVNNTGYNYTKIGNCTIVQGGSINRSHAIFFNRSVGNLIINNSIQTYNDTNTIIKRGIYFFNTNSSNITNNTIRTYEGMYNDAVLIGYGSEYNRIDSNIIVTNGTYSIALYLWSSSYNNLTNNNVSTSNENGYGVYMGLSNYTYISYNNISAKGAYSEGIEIYESAYSNVTGNHINTTSLGVYVYTSTTFAFFNHSIDTSNTVQGEPIYYYFNTNNTVIENIDNIGELYLGFCSNDTIRNITLNRGGINVAYSQRMKIYNNILNGSWIALSESADYNNVTNNTLSRIGGGYIVISIYKSIYNNITDNHINITGSQSAGIYPASSSNYNNIIDNIISTNSGGSGIDLWSSCNYNNISGNNISANGTSSLGIYLESSSNYNKISNNTIVTNGSSGHGIDIYTSSYNNLTNNSITTFQASSYGIYLYRNSDSNIIANSSIQSKASYAIYLANTTTLKPENNVIYNNLLNGSALPVSGTSGWVVITNFWNISNQTGSRIYFGGNRIGGNYYTNSTGNGWSDTCTESDRDGFCDSSYNVTTNTECYGASCGNNTDYLALSDEVNPISTCFNFTIPNKYYILSNNVSSSGSCMNITANNITLDCQGYTINYSQSEVGYAVNNTGYNYTSIRNCKIVQGLNRNYSYALNYNRSGNGSIFNNNIITTGNYSNGIYLYNSSNNNISQTNVSTSGTNANGIWLSSESNYNNISSNKISTSSPQGYGIVVNYSLNNNISFNNVSTSSYYSDGITLIYSRSNNLSGNNINTTNSYALTVSGSTNSSNYNNSIDTSNTEQGKPIYYYSNINNTVIGNMSNIGELILAACNNVTIRNITIDKDGAIIRYTFNSTINSSYIYASATYGYGILIDTSSGYNNFSYNYINSNGTFGYAILFSYDADNNIISNSTIKSNRTYAIYLSNTTSSTQKPENNTIYNCLLNGSAQPVGGTANWGNIINFWNTSNQTGNRTYGNGNRMGGNYYTNSSGTGYSDICSDTDTDGFCDSSYNVTTNSACSGATCGNNTDYLALSNDYTKKESYRITTANGGEFIIFNGSTPYNTSSLGNINDGNWHHIAATYDGFTMKIYVDGLLKSINTNYTGILPSEGELQAGNDCDFVNNRFFNGSIDELKIFNVTLSAAEIFDDYVKGLKS